MNRKAMAAVFAAGLVGLSGGVVSVARSAASAAVPSNPPCTSLPSRGPFVTPPVADGCGPFGATEIERAYGLSGLAQTSGAGNVVAVIGQGHDADALSDMNTYRKQYGLPSCTASRAPAATATHCSFYEANPAGIVAARGNAELASDLDMVSTGCPLCSIYLIDATDRSAPAMYAAYAVEAKLQPRALVVTNSFFVGTENDPHIWGSHLEFRVKFDRFFRNHSDTTFVFPTGDQRYTPGAVTFPAASPYVLAVGGVAPSSEPWSERAWASNDTSGCSQTEPRVTWQASVSLPGCAGRRLIPDIAAINAYVLTFNSDPAYDATLTRKARHWELHGGTSVSAPQSWAISDCTA